MSKILIALSVLALAAPAAAQSHYPEYTAEQTEFVGWVRFSNGEFQLHNDRDQMRQPFSRPCVSGAASRDLMRQAVQGLAGQKVRITGRTAAWSHDLPGHRMEFEHSNIRNDCQSTFVILADDIRPAN